MKSGEQFPSGTLLMLSVVAIVLVLMNFYQMATLRYEVETLQDRVGKMERRMFPLFGPAGPVGPVGPVGDMPRKQNEL